MAEDKVTIDPEFLPPPPGDGRGSWLRAVGVVGVVAVILAVGWLLRSPTSIEVDSDARKDTSSSTAAGETAVESNMNVRDPVATIDLGMPLGEAVSGFTDTITMAVWTETGGAVLRWPASQSSAETIGWSGLNTGRLSLDASATWYAVVDQFGVLGVHRLGDPDSGPAFSPDPGTTGARYIMPLWHGTEPGQLAWLACAKIGGLTLYRWDAADGTTEPVADYLAGAGCPDAGESTLQAWGDWGYLLYRTEDDGVKGTILGPDGNEIVSPIDHSAHPWLVAASPYGTIWNDESLGLDTSSFLLLPDGLSVMPVPGLAAGERLDAALWSPDGTRIALSVRTRGDDNPALRIVNPHTAAVVAEITEPDWEDRPAAWSSDSRFLLSQHQLCPESCDAREPQARQMAFYDTMTDTTTIVAAPVGHGWSPWPDLVVLTP